MKDSILLAQYGAIYTPWFPRQADNAKFFFELVDASSTGSLQVDVFHKSEDDAGDPSTAFATLSATTAKQVHSLTASGLKELVRFKITQGGTGDAQWILFRFLGSVDYNTASA